MADDEGKKGLEGKETTEKTVNVEGSATVESDKGTEHEVDLTAQAKVRSLAEQQEKHAEATQECVYCGPIEDGTHWSADCPVAQRQASHAADRPTAKAAVAQRPSSFSRSGNVD